MRRLVVAMVAALAACTPSEADSRSPTDHDALARFHMRERYSLLGAIQHLAIRDKVYEVQVIARLIADAPDEPALASWKTQAGLARSSARELSRAPHGVDACRRVARLAATCANCHVDAKAAAVFGTPSAPPIDDGTIDARMARHVWATDRLFDGIIGAATDSWTAGLDVLSRTAVDRGPAELTDRLRRLATDARSHAEHDDFATRARIYGDLLITCRGCHAAEQARSTPP